MTDKRIFHIGDTSPEQIAFKLFEMVAQMENKSTKGWDQRNLDQGWTNADRKYVLDTYAECLNATLGGRIFASDT